MGAMTSAILFMGAMKGVSQIAGASNVQREAEAQAGIVDANATRLVVQAGMIEQSKGIRAAQDDRAIRFTIGDITARTAAKGLRMSGSPVNILIDTVTQMEIDKSITQYNFDVQKRRTLTESNLTNVSASNLRSKGQSAFSRGVAGAVSTFSESIMYQAASSFDYSKKINLDAGAKKASGSFIRPTPIF